MDREQLQAQLAAAAARQADELRELAEDHRRQLAPLRSALRTATRQERQANWQAFFTSSLDGLIERAHQAPPERRLHIESSELLAAPRICTELPNAGAGRFLICLDVTPNQVLDDRAWRLCCKNLDLYQGSRLYPGEAWAELEGFVIPDPSSLGYRKTPWKTFDLVQQMLTDMRDEIRSGARPLPPCPFDPRIARAYRKRNAA